MVEYSRPKGKVGQQIPPAVFTDGILPVAITGI